MAHTFIFTISQLVTETCNNKVSQLYSGYEYITTIAALLSE